MLPLIWRIYYSLATYVVSFDSYNGIMRQTLEIPHLKEEIKSIELALAGVAQWIELQPANQRVTGLIPSQSTSLSCGPGPQDGVCERQPHIDVSLPLFLPPFPSV